MGEAITFGVLVVDLVIHGMVADLGSPSYHRREQASAAVSRMLPMALPHLEKAMKSRDLEVACRSDRIIAEFYEDRAEYLASRLLPGEYPCLPWIDMLPTDHPGREYIIRSCLSSAKQQSQPAKSLGWPEYRMATKIFIRNLIAQRMPASHVVELLNRMAARELSWIARNRHNPNVPEHLAKR